MWFNGLSKGIHEKLEHVLCIELIDSTFQVVVSLGHCFYDGRIFLVGQLQAKVVIFDAQTPQLIQFLHVLGPACILAIKRVILVYGEIKRLLDPRTGIVGALPDTVHIDIEYFVGWQQVRVPKCIIQTASIAFEHRDIRAEKIDPVGVQELEVFIEYFARKLIVQACILVMPVGQELGGQVGGIALIDAGLEDQR